jgi:hypothetical protein
MALIFCPECGTQISEYAQQCVKCAYPISEKLNSAKGYNNLQDLSLQYNNINHVSVNNNVVWILAFAPIIGVFLQAFIVGFLYGDSWMYSYNKFWWVTLALNILLCYLDEKKLMQAGINTDNMGATWIIPIYLYRRAEVLNQSPSYLWVWIVTFILSFFI